MFRELHAPTSRVLIMIVTQLTCNISLPWATREVDATVDGSEIRLTTTSQLGRNKKPCK